MSRPDEDVRSGVSTGTGTMADRAPVSVPRTFALPGILLGIGLGGLLYGIVFSRLLNWHHVLTTDQPMTGDGLTANLRADGIYDLVSLGFVVAGLIVLWAYRKQMGGLVPYGSGVRLTGWILVGWATFNIVEGVLAHLIFDMHHINENDPNATLAWDLGFLAVSVVIGAIGLAMAMRRTDDRRMVTGRTTEPGTR